MFFIFPIGKKMKFLDVGARELLLSTLLLSTLLCVDPHRHEVGL